VISATPNPRLNGLISTKKPSAISPNKPPKPKLCAHVSAGIWAAIKMAANAVNMGEKIMRLIARVSPMWNTKRRPHVMANNGIVHAALPIVSINVLARAAPNSPNMF